MIKKNTDIDPDMDLYKKNLRRHRLKNLAIVLGILAVIVLVAVGLRISLENRTFVAYEVLNSYERVDTMNTQYTEFQGCALKYGKDGISCVDSENKLVWSQTYSMQNPVVDVCGESVVVAEKNGTEALIFDKTGLQGNVQTRLPIQQISVSSQGVLAVLLEDGDIMRLNLYNKKGEELVTSKFELQDAGYPIQMSLSEDATKLAVSFLQVSDGSVNSCLAFYNFDSVGENHEDHLVAAKTVQGNILPSVEYLDSTHCFAVGTGQILLYKGDQIPELQKEIPVEKEILSVFYSDQYLGIVMKGEEQKYLLQVYDVGGELEFETGFDMEYRTLKFSGKNILIYNDFECMMLNHAGNVFYSGTFEESISNLYTLSGSTHYMIMHASRSDRIHLK